MYTAPSRQETSGKNLKTSSSAMISGGDVPPLCPDADASCWDPVRHEHGKPVNLA
ncbi:MAG: hypothetical protein GDA56_14270 [Hormoscilla sp. GM7CHS1pb]|nr:hypothetical protein [Hormoscilla sp. GM7CHS1pb]